MSIADDVAGESTRIMMRDHPQIVIFVFSVCGFLVGIAAAMGYFWSQGAYAEKATEQQVIMLKRSYSAINLQIQRTSLKDELREMRREISSLERLVARGEATPRDIADLDDLKARLPDMQVDLDGLSRRYQNVKPKALEEWDIRDRGEGRR
jgi:hypothetical protein